VAGGFVRGVDIRELVGAGVRANCPEVQCDAHCVQVRWLVASVLGLDAVRASNAGDKPARVPGVRVHVRPGRRSRRTARFDVGAAAGARGDQARSGTAPRGYTCASRQHALCALHHPLAQHHRGSCVHRYRPRANGGFGASGAATPDHATCGCPAGKHKCHRLCVLTIEEGWTFCVRSEIRAFKKETPIEWW